MIPFSTFFFFLTICILSSVSALGCTLYGSAGESTAEGGTLVAKNRDWRTEGTQKLKLVSEGKIAYYALFMEGGSDPGIKAGINEKGLTILSASASSIPTKIRHSYQRTHNIPHKILSQYATVDEALKFPDWKGPMFYMLSDATKIAYIEINPDGTTYIKETSNGHLEHTNQYLEKTQFNIKITESSQVRLKRIQDLMNSNKKLNFENFKKFSHDENDGPDNSLFRKGKKSKVKTQAIWITHYAPSTPPEVFIWGVKSNGEEFKEEKQLSQIFTKNNK